MNKCKNFILLLALLAMPASIAAEDVVQVTPFTTTAGISLADEETFSMEMVNTNAYTALEFHLFLPEGITLDKDFIDLNPDRFPGKYRRGVFYPDHVCDVTNPSPGHYYVKIYNSDLETIEGTEGEILSFYYATAADMKPGIYPIRVTGTILAVDSHNSAEPPASVSFVKITDANGNVPANALLDLGSDEIPSFVQTELPEKNVIIGGVCENLVLTDGADFETANAFTATQASLTTNVNAYKTLVLPFDAAVPTGFTAKNAVSVTGTSIDLEASATINAGQPVLIEGEGLFELSASNVAVAATSDANLTNGLLCGTYKAITASVGSYVLQKHGNVIGFYLVEDVQPFVRAFHAYLNIPDPGVKALFFSDEATGIGEEINEKLKMNDDVFDLSGRKVNGQLPKGVYIMNDHKVLF